MSNIGPLAAYPALLVRQRRELGEFFGYESRNKYEVLTAEGHPVLYAAESGKGFGAVLARQFFGHWRTFEIHVFDMYRNPVLRAVHPFRFFFQRLEVFDASGNLLGAIQQRFALFSKRFDVLDPAGNLLFTVSSPFWRMWTFPFERAGRQVAVIAKKWGGVVRELFTDADTFRVDYQPELSPPERALVLAASLFIDLQYFEKKAEA
ncbi:phospholipid scramblase-related protein [Pendulispora albinea]|uniref:Scramblase n=1 Tax=Pendulispora albinea TaxID=2741071 RepID=A0ABZ2LT45_9BACT